MIDADLKSLVGHRVRTESSFWADKRERVMVVVKVYDKGILGICSEEEFERSVRQDDKPKHIGIRADDPRLHTMQQREATT